MMNAYWSPFENSVFMLWLNSDCTRVWVRPLKYVDYIILYNMYVW